MIPCPANTHHPHESVTVHRCNSSRGIQSNTAQRGPRAGTEGTEGVCELRTHSYCWSLDLPTYGAHATTGDRDRVGSHGSSGTEDVVFQVVADGAPHPDAHPLDAQVPVAGVPRQDRFSAAAPANSDVLAPLIVIKILPMCRFRGTGWRSRNGRRKGTKISRACASRAAFFFDVPDME
jgi:hypothetical protein